jgi:hypothetical protein
MQMIGVCVNCVSGLGWCRKKAHIKATQQRELCGFFIEVDFGDANIYYLKQESETKLSTVRFLCDVHVQYCTNV